ncbi:MAG: hypothetical protein JNK94_03570 [Hyphomonadaceae bacterium]|nr:hypothetical protein [Hyphomonadaceae bacterium]
MPDNDELIRNAETIRPTHYRAAEPAIDPYAPPPRHKDRSGALVRIVAVGALLAAAIAGYSYVSSQPVQPLVAAEAEPAPQQFAESDPGLIPASPSDFAETPPAPAAPPAANAAPAPAPVAPPQEVAPPAIEPLQPAPQGQ